MLKKIVKIENVGRLRNLAWHKNPEMSRFVGIYAENGAGKTTLVATLRAARDGLDAPLRERRSLSASK